MKWLETRVPPLVVLFAAGALAWLTPQLTLTLPGLDMAGLLIAALGVIVCGAGIAEFRRARTTVSPVDPSAASALVDTGIYRWTRNPMYLGMAMLLLGWTIILGNPAGLLAVPLFQIYLNTFQIRTEEFALRGLFGDAYIAYCARVRRWI